MSSRGKRKFDVDPNASDPDDYDYDASERAPPQRRRNRGTPGAKKKAPKRQRRVYGGSDVDEDDEIVSDDSFTDRSESAEPEINPATGRSVRRATKKQIKYEESEEDEIEDTPSEGDDDKPLTATRRRAKPSIEEVAKPSLIVKLKMNRAPGRNLRIRTSSKSIARGKTPEVTGTRRSSRLSHDVETPIVALSDSGRHVNVVREGTRSPEPVTTRATRGGKGPKVQQYPSAIMEASQEASMVRDEDDDGDESAGPLDELLQDAETQVEASKESSPVQEAQSKPDDEEGLEGVIQESQHDGAPDDSEEEGPVTRGGRSLRVSFATQLTHIHTDMTSQLVPDQPNRRRALMRAATSSPVPKMKRRKMGACQNQIMESASGQTPKAHRARHANVFVAGHGSRSAADSSRRRMTTRARTPRRPRKLQMNSRILGQNRDGGTTDAFLTRTWPTRQHLGVAHATQVSTIVWCAQR
jgi:hypothetical protein